MNVFACRLPNEPRPQIYELGAPSETTFGEGPLRVTVAPFSPDEEVLQYPVTGTLSSIPDDIFQENRKEYNFSFATEEEYASYIADIKSCLAGDTQKKIVASRRVKVTTTKNINTLFRDLCKAYPEAYVFVLSTRELGTWIGASPELLLEKKKGILTSMALAGTRLAGASEEWDTKNRMEQAIVARYITSVFKSHGLQCDEEGPETHIAGRIEHLKTTLTADATSIDPSQTYQLARNLSPTPALAGYPKEEAIEMICRAEGDRALYGGWFGLIEPSGDFRLHVMLRCLWMPTATEGVAFAGGGITSLSDARAEWEETRRKLATIASIL